MNARKQLYLMIAILLFIGFSLTLYKYHVLGFSLTPGQTETVWRIQARINFLADGGPVRVKMTLPETGASQKLAYSENLAKAYRNEIRIENGIEYSEWSREFAEGEQTIYLRGDFYQFGTPEKKAAPVKPAPQKTLEGRLEIAGQRLLARAAEQSDTTLGLATELLGIMNEERDDPDVQTLLGNIRYRREFMERAAGVLALGGIHSEVVRGLHLQGNYTQRSITTFLQIFTDDRWILIDSKALRELPITDLLIWPKGTRGLLDVYGGRDSRLDLSVSSAQLSAGQLAIASGKLRSSALVDFSIYSLPIMAQNTFKLLLLIPFGALVVVILRNLVGIRTSGTFMPILIAMVFMQTSLLLGLALFLVVVGVGLAMRSYLSHLNLLLVPRIASVLVFVIIIYAAIGIISHKLGWEAGLAVTFFPMIILSWTIERMSVLWEEEGGREVLIQGGGSLLTASIAFLVMDNTFIRHLTFNFPELLLVLLAVIIMIGSYSGFRLLELGRFEPMTRDID